MPERTHLPGVASCAHEAETADSSNLGTMRQNRAENGLNQRKKVRITVETQSWIDLFCFGWGWRRLAAREPAARRRGAGMQGMPVQTAAVALAPGAAEQRVRGHHQVAPLGHDHAAGERLLTEIRVHSGDHVKAGQVLMKIDPRQQQATVDAQRATERQKKALYDYNTMEVERQRKLFDAGVTSRDAYDQAQQAYENAKADYESAVQRARRRKSCWATTRSARPSTAWWAIFPCMWAIMLRRSSTPTLTTVDENKDLEAYIYVPTERASQVRMGLEVDLTDNGGKLLEKTKIDFVSPEVDTTLQGILVKAPVHSSPEMLRTAQMIKARVIWSTTPMAVVPVLAVTRQGGQSFVYVAQQQNGHYVARADRGHAGRYCGQQLLRHIGAEPGRQA